MNKNKDRFKRIALLLCICAAVGLIYFTVLRSVCYLHQCTGEECAVCHQLRQADGISKNLSLAAGGVLPGCMMAAMMTLTVPGGAPDVMRRTLVADKVRIDR